MDTQPHETYYLYPNKLGFYIGFFVWLRHY